jgi:hypothetical protein
VRNCRGSIPHFRRRQYAIRRSHASFSYQAGSRKKPRRTIVKAEWHPGELYPLVGFIVTTMAWRAENVSPSTTSAARASD